MGDAAGFSLYPTKVLGAYGDGGAVLTADDEVAARLRRSRYYGMEDRYYVVATPGHNSRLDEVQAEILRRGHDRTDGSRSPDDHHQGALVNRTGHAVPPTHRRTRHTMCTRGT
jgi:DegT/DnrJ/EryC1/StrS aminotransferase family protein